MTMVATSTTRSMIAFLALKLSKQRCSGWWILTDTVLTKVVWTAVMRRILIIGFHGIRTWTAWPVFIRSIPKRLSQSCESTGSSRRRNSTSSETMARSAAYGIHDLLFIRRIHCIRLKCSSSLSFLSTKSRKRNYGWASTTYCLTCVYSGFDGIFSRKFLKHASFRRMYLNFCEKM